MKLIDADTFKQRALRAYGFAAVADDDFMRGKASAFWEVASWVDQDAQIYDDNMRFRVSRTRQELRDAIVRFAQAGRIPADVANVLTMMIG